MTWKSVSCWLSFRIYRHHDVAVHSDPNKAVVFIHEIVIIDVTAQTEVDVIEACRWTREYRSAWVIATATVDVRRRECYKITLIRFLWVSGVSRKPDKVSAVINSFQVVCGVILITTVDYLACVKILARCRSMTSWCSAIFPYLPLPLVQYSQCHLVRSILIHSHQRNVRTRRVAQWWCKVLCTEAWLTHPHKRARGPGSCLWMEQPASFRTARWGGRCRLIVDNFRSLVASFLDVVGLFRPVAGGFPPSVSQRRCWDVAVAVHTGGYFVGSHV